MCPARKSVSFNSRFLVEERKDLYVPFQQTNDRLSQLQHIHFNLRTMTLLAIFKLNGDKSSWIKRPGKGIILSVRSQAVFEE